MQKNLRFSKPIGKKKALRICTYALDTQPLWEGGCPVGAFRGGFSVGEIRRLRRLRREGIPERLSRS